MDVDNVSNDARWKQMLEQQKRNLQAASKRKGERPRDRKSYSQLLQQFTMKFVMKNAAMSQNEHMIHQSWVPPPYAPSVAPLKSLEKLYLDDLCLETHHRGSYVLLRVATPPYVMTAVMAVMEDERNNGVLLQLYQQEDEDHQLGEGEIRMRRVCIVKEAYFKLMNDGDYGLRVDHVSDIIWLDPDDDRIPLDWQTRICDLDQTAEALKEEGNLALKAGKLNAAMESYTSALRLLTTSEMSQILKLNRSLVNLKLQRYDDALVNAAKLNDDTQQSEKSYYRSALALYGLGRYQEAHETLQNLLSHYPHCDAAKKELLRTEQRLREQKHGDYDFKKMYEAAKATPPCLDNATFDGNVEVKASKGRGRGLFTTKDVKAGELLLCEKAFTYCSAQHSKTSLLMNIHTNQMTMGTQADLITATIQKLARNPSLKPAVISLHHGDYNPLKETEVDGMPVIDSFLVERVLALNIFGCPRTSLESHIGRDNPKAKDQQMSHHTSGLFVKASYINHSCYSNARRSFIGDMQIVRASRNIPAGSEIFFWYTLPTAGHTYEKTQEGLKHWGFQCDCAICQQNKTTKKNMWSKRLALKKDFEAAIGSERSTADLLKAERVLQAIEKTHAAPASEVPRLAVAEGYAILTHIYSVKNRYDKVVESAWKAITSLGSTVKKGDPKSLSSPFVVEQWGLMQDYLIQTWVQLCTAYAQLGLAELSNKAEEHARTTYRICIGEGGSFDETYGEGARQASLGKSAA